MYHGKPYQMTLAETIKVTIPADKLHLLQCTKDVVPEKWIDNLRHMDNIMIQYSDNHVIVMPGDHFNVSIVRDKSKDVHIECNQHIRYK